jgi:hypothetical protein
MATRIEDNFMTAKYDGRVIATARYSENAAAEGQGAWTVSGHPRRLFTRNQAITAMVLAERLVADYGDDDPFIVDNGSDQCGKAAIDRLRTAHPNVIMIHTPVHASWSNQRDLLYH